MVTVNFYNLPIAVLVNLIPLIFSLAKSFKEKYYTKRSVAVTNGLLIIATGISLIIFNPSLFIYKIPLSFIPILYGFFVVLLTSQRSQWGLRLGRSIVIFVLALLILILQLGILAF